MPTNLYHVAFRNQSILNAILNAKCRHFVSFDKFESFLKPGGERKKGNLMAGSNHNQLYSSWDLYPGKEGRQYTRIFLFKLPCWEVGRKKKEIQFQNKRKKARLNERQPKMSYNQDNTY